MVKETCMMILKYPNVYADTSALYFDSAYEFYEYLLNRSWDMGGWTAACATEGDVWFQYAQV